MKFVIAAVVLLAVAMGVQSSLVAGLGYGVSGLGYGINGLAHGVNGIGLVNGLGAHGLGVNGLGVNGLGLGHGLGISGYSLGVGSAWAGVPAAVNIAGPALVAPAHVPAAVNVVSSPAAYGYASQVALAAAPHAAIAAPLAAHGATYVAKTRGAVHTAPLAGHIKSAASINVAPAPGTW